MFFISKLLSSLTQPLTWVFLLILVGLLRGRHQPARGRRLVWAGMLILLVLGWTPIPDVLLRRIEQAQPAPAAAGDKKWDDYAGVVVLGGALENAFVRGGNNQVGLNSAAERMTTTVALAQAHPNLKVIFTGGDGNLKKQPESEAVQAKQFFAEMGLPAHRLAFEATSRTTYENAVYSAQLPGVDAKKPWLLLTSAWHMPRSLATFRKVGWNVTPYTVDYLTGVATPWNEYSMATSLMHWQRVLHETAGLWGYRLSGQAE
jgi:uncharacterized SAM-binding protein YcdF (DUF218 family)